MKSFLLKIVGFLIALGFALYFGRIQDTLLFTSTTFCIVLPLLVSIFKTERKAVPVRTSSLEETVEKWVANCRPSDFQ